VGFSFQKWRNSTRLRLRLAANPFEKAFSLYLGILSGTYIYLLTISLEPFRCFKQPDGTSTLVASPDLDCYDVVWNKHRVSIFFGLQYIVLIPAFLVSILWKNRKIVDSNVFQWRFGLLTSRYKPQFFWWSIYLLAKKTVVVMLIDLTNDFSVFLRSYLVLLVLVTTLVIESLCKPLKRSNQGVNIWYGVLIVFSYSNQEWSQLVSFPHHFLARTVSNL
jgi:hypothetical protein